GMCVDVFVFFFFQAEDGIRDDLVTGVQTCALPILDLMKRLDDTVAGMRERVDEPLHEIYVRGAEAPEGQVNESAVSLGDVLGERSEERRVGKGGRGGGRSEA